MGLLNTHLSIDILEFELIVTVAELSLGLLSFMGDTNETRRTRSEMENLSLQTTRFSRDLLQRFMGSTDSKKSDSDGSRVECSDEIELNLGLSLGGRFGVDTSDTRLLRSSSVAGSIPIVRDDDVVAPPPVAYPALVRTSSLPVEMEDEWRKRKEMQTLRRMEAKRRRSEKQKNKDGCSGGSGGGPEAERREVELNLRGQGGGRKSGSTVPPFGLPTWVAAARQANASGGMDVAMAKGMGNYACGGGSSGGAGSGSGGDGGGFGQLGSQGSIESQGGSSSSMSELESKQFQRSSSCGELSPVSIQSLQDRSNKKDVVIGSKTTNANETESSSRRVDGVVSRGKERVRNNSMEDMPCVFTVGDGPSGRRVEGILYKYGKGEQVRIMCVCHGNFHSPAEFVKHAGGSDVAHPLKHIVVNPNAAAAFR